MKRLAGLAVLSLLAIGCAEAPKTTPPAPAVDPAKMMEGSTTPMPGESAPAATPTEPTPTDPAATPDDKPKEGEPTPTEPEKPADTEKKE